MLKRITENLDRQHKGVLLLKTLLEEEYSLLQKGEAQEVSRIELSLQELMRQIMQERMNLKAMVKQVNQGAERLAHLYDVMPSEAAEEIKTVLATIDSNEQVCAKQADKNRIMALGFHEQSSSMINFLQEKMKPKSENTYSARGRYAQVSPQAALLSGRF